MSKIFTKIKGTTFYQIDFSRLVPGDKLNLVRDPKNPYDSNAIKILHRDMMLGHVERDIASVLANIMDCGTEVSATFTKLIGGPQNNYGIAISISIHEKRKPEYYKKNNIEEYVENIDSFSLIESSIVHELNYINIDYNKSLYFKKKYDLKEKLSVGTMPDFRALYRSKTNIFQRFFSNHVENFVKEETIKWKNKLEKINAHNNEIDAKIKEYEEKFDEKDYLLHKKIYFINYIVNKLGIKVKDKRVIEDDILNGYVTTYEVLLYEKLLGKIWMHRQVVIKGYQVDFILFNLEKNKIWALEIDGGVHRLINKFNRDNECAKELNAIGISLIRISNNLISRNIDSAAERIIDIVNG